MTGFIQEGLKLAEARWVHGFNLHASFYPILPYVQNYQIEQDICYSQKEMSNIWNDIVNWDHVK